MDCVEEALAVAGMMSSEALWVIPRQIRNSDRIADKVRALVLFLFYFMFLLPLSFFSSFSFFVYFEVIFYLL